MKNFKPTKIASAALNVASNARLTSRLVRSGPRPMALEQRFMFDGAALIDAVDTLDHTTPDATLLTTAEVVHAPLLVVESAPAMVQTSAQEAETLVKDYLASHTDAELFTLFNGGQADMDAAWAERLDSLRSALTDGTFHLNVVEMDSASQFTAIAAFAAEGPNGEPTIFINSYWFGMFDSPDATRALVEELGHAIDHYLNPTGDTAGDEGEAFADVVLDGAVSADTLSALSTQSDRGTVTVAGVSYDVEFASFNFVNAYEMVYDLDNDTATSAADGGTIDSSDIDTTERWADKEQNLHYFNASDPLGAVGVNDGTGDQNFSGNDVSATALIIGGVEYYGWISRPIKDQGIVRGFYFWTDADFVARDGHDGFYWAQQDSNADGDRSILDNRGFLLVVDQAWFNTQITDTGVAYNGGAKPLINNTKDGDLGSITVARIGSSSDRVDTALNSLIVPNSAPQAANDTLSVAEDSGTSTVSAANGLLNNDSDPNNDPLTITAFSVGGVSTTVDPDDGGTYPIPGVGSITINKDGSYSFTPEDDYNGPVPPITYTVSDGKGGTTTAVLSITVTPVNDAPLAVDDSDTVTEDTPASGSLLDDDSDPDGDALTVSAFSIADQDGDFVLGSPYLIDGVGTLTINANGTYTFVPAANYSGAIPLITYTISDGNGGTDTATLTLTMDPVDDAPVANPDNADGTLFAQAPHCDNGSMIGETPQTGNVLSNDTDGDVAMDEGVTHTVTAASNELGANATWATTVGTLDGRYGVLTINANGSYSYNITETNPLVMALNANQTLSETFTYTMEDETGLTASSTLRIVIKGANNAPNAVDDQGYVQVIGSSSPYDTTTGDVTDNDVDVDGDSLDNVTSISTVSSTYKPGVFTNNMNSFPATVTTVAVGIASSGSTTAASSATYTSIASNVDIDVSGSTLNSFSFTNLDAFEAYKDTHPLSAGQSYYVRVISGQTGYIEVGAVSESTSQAVTGPTDINGSYGTLHIDTYGVYTYTLTQNPGAGTYHDRFTYTVTDGSCTSTATLDITIIGATNLQDFTVHVNEDPLSPLTGTLTAVGGGAITIASFTITDANGSTTPGDLLGDNTVTGGSLTLNADGEYSFTPDANYNGAVPIVTYTLADGSKAVLNIIVDPVNDAPAGTNKTVTLTDQQTYTFSAYDFGFSDPNDSPADSFLNVKITTLPASGTLTYNGVAVTAGQSISVANLNLLVFTPAANSATDPSTSFNFQVQDDGGTSNGGLNLDQSPNTFTLNVSRINDAPVNTLPATVSTNSYTSVAFNSLATVISATDPDRLDATNNIHTIVLQVTDGILVLGGDSGSTGGTGYSLSGNGTGTVTITATNDNEADLQAILATLVYTPDPTFSGTDTLTMTTTDHGGLTDIDSVAIAVGADDRTVTVMGSVVNEASPYVMFEVTGVENQWVSLELGTTGSGTGHATMGTDFLPNLQYFDGSNWQDYNGGLIRIPDTTANDGKLLVRAAVLQDSEFETTSAGYETLKLTATNAAGTPNAVTGSVDILAEGMAQIRDDGEGSIYLGNNNTFTANDPGDTDPDGPGYPAYLDDDRPVTVDNIAVNEGSPWAMFTISGYAGQELGLALHNGTATIGDGGPADGSEDYGIGLEYWNDSVWTAYNTSVTMTGSTLLVRTAIHQDDLFEGQHSFSLGVTKLSSATTVYGTCDIYDDGTGSKYEFDDINDGTATITSGPGTGFDDDRTLTIDSPVVNEASDYVVFTLTGNSGQTVSLELVDESSDGTVTGKANIDETQTLQVWNGIDWVDYDPTNLPTFDGNGKIFVRVDIIVEQDPELEISETFKLNATLTGQSTVVTGTATIKDDGTGDKYPGTFTDGEPTTDNTDLDNDVPDEADLVTTKVLSSGDATPAEGDTVMFTVTVRNNGSAQATGVDLRDTWPSGLEFVSANASQGSYVDGLWTIGTLNNGQSVTLVLTGTVKVGEGGRTITNVVSPATGDQPDPTNSGNDLSEAVVVDGGADLVTTKVLSSGDATPAEGDTVMFTVTVRNNGSAQATGVDLRDTWPSGLEFVSANASQGSYVDGLWTIGTLNNGQSVTLVLTGTVKVGEGGRTITNVVSPATGDQPDPTNSGNDLSEAVEVDEVVIAEPPVIEVIEPAPAVESAPAPVDVPPEPLPPFDSATVMQVTSPTPPLEIGTFPVEAILTSDIGFPVLVADPANTSLPPNLTLANAVTDQFADPGIESRFAIPYDTFAHTKADAQITLLAKQQDGSDLPSWVVFDPQSGTFTVNPPADLPENLRELKLMVIARDQEGREAVAPFRFFVGEEKAKPKAAGRLSLSEQLKLAGKRSATPWAEWSRAPAEAKPVARAAAPAERAVAHAG